MTTQARRVLKSLGASIKTNAPRIERKFIQSGRAPDPAIVFSAAKYYETLKKLAKE